MNLFSNKGLSKVLFFSLAAIGLVLVPLNSQSAFGYGSTLGSNTSQNTPIDLNSGVTAVIGGNIGSQPLTSYNGGDLNNTNLSTLGIGKAVTLASSTPGSAINIVSPTITNASIVIPDTTTILAPAGWDGFINPPTAGSNAGTTPSGFSVGGSVIEVGSATSVLFFDKPIDIVLTGVTGSVGYKPAGSSSWNQITTACGGTYANPTAPAFPGECYISNGTDTKIHTFHLTSFAGLVANTPSNSNTSSSSNNNGGSGVSDGKSDGKGGPQPCGDEKPASAPRLISAVPAGENKVILTWTEAKNPVSYYLVTFGNKPGQQLYGNPNVGGKGTTSYVVTSLSSDQTYYFKVRAGNGCTPGAFSNEVSVKPAGAILTNVPEGFAPGVLGAKTQITPEATKGAVKTVVITQIPAGSQAPKTQQPSDNGGFFGAIGRFFAHLFGK